MKNKENTFAYWGYFFNAPLSLNDNIREWISTNIPEEYQKDRIPTDVDFTSLDTSLTSTTVEGPDWYRHLDTYLRGLLYCCIQAVKQPSRKEAGKVMDKDSILKDKRKAMGESIRAMRTAQGWKQEQLAQIAGITVANVRSIESGKYAVNIDVLNKIACALGAELRMVEKGV